MSKIWQDLKTYERKYYKKSFFHVIKSMILIPEFRMLILYRLSHHYYKKNKLRKSSLIYSLNYLMSGCEIKPSAILGENIMFPHAVGIVIGEGVVIGNNCIIYQNVTLGTDKVNTHNYPIVGNNVCLYCSCSVIGKVTVGNYVIIGAHSLVLNDLPNRSVAVGIPAKIIKKNDD